MNMYGTSDTQSGKSKFCILGNSDKSYVIPIISIIPEKNTNNDDNFEISLEKILVKKERAIAGAMDIKTICIKELEGSMVVCGPDAFGPIKKEKNDVDKKMNNTTKPITATDNHSPVFNITIFLVNQLIILIFLNYSHQSS